MYIREQFANAPVEQFGTGFKLAFGPVEIPLYGGGARDLKVRIYAKVTGGTGTYRVFLSRKNPSGDSESTTSYIERLFATDVDLSTTSTSYVYTAETTMSNPARQAGSPPTAWLTVEEKNSGSNTTTLAGVFVRESPT
jgi:hypothetical protein